MPCSRAPRRPVQSRLLISTAMVLLAQAAIGGAWASEEPRTTVPLATGWRFHLGAADGAERTDYADASWAPVSVPHSWNRVGYYLGAGHQKIHTPDSVNKTQGQGWYRLVFDAPGMRAGQRVWLQFDAASRTAEVWLNGQRLGAHDGGFSRFRFDATAAIKPGQPNLLAVKTDNTKPAPGAPTADSLPLSGDFFVHGGLYRPVSLIVTNPIHLDLADHGGPGVYADTLSIQDGDARVRVRARLVNDHAAKGPRTASGLSVRASLVDDKGQVAATQTTPLRLAPGETREVEQVLDVAQARLWRGVDDPFLYRLKVEVRDAKGRTLDRVEQAFGIRKIRIDPERGLFLNDQPLKLHGVGLHQDEEGKGWARSEADIARDVAIIRDMGANTIRLTHYQHGTPIHDLADRYGLILWDEIALVTAWTPPGKTEPTEGLVQNAERQLKELIRQNYNHASVAAWGVANEVDMGNSLPAFISGVHPDADPLPLLHRLNALSKAEDPTRPVVQAACCEGRLYDAKIKVPNVAPATELLGVNRYFGWYYGAVEDLEADLAGLRAKRPEQPLSVSEYGAGGAISIHTDNPLGGPPDMRGQDQPEDYLSNLHERSWKILADKPFLWGTWLWNSFDFATTIRREGDAQDINTKGLVTYDRQIRKDAFYFYRANWSAEPTVRITGRRYVDRAYGVTDIKVYSNAPSTEMTLNGRSLGERSNCPQKVCVWTGVRLTQGENTLLARGRFPDKETTDTISWTLSPDAARNVRIDSGTLVAAPASQRHGSDTFFEGGRAQSVNTPANYGQPPQKRTIANTADAAVVATYREGDFTYRIPVADGRYRVTLTFVEPSLAASARRFDVSLDGKPFLQGFDVAAAAGAPLTAVTRDVVAEARGGLITLAFTGRKGAALVSAIAVTPE